jgi:alkylation response protein AidB-like acyl-CoA dehydrogenase
MDFELNEEQRAIQNMARDFAVEQLAPYAKEWDATEFFPVAALRKAAELGLAGLLINNNIGGAQ